ncbi:hypothetical protein R3P38DRAFT_2854723 [Favolaschia claudopus]|uniref:F-box domain-containing protein n=1 Tax=Favolaschia claudopus TaxID=2862362 RepID=A0AAW0DNL8_9AGAR
MSHPLRKRLAELDREIASKRRKLFKLEKTRSAVETELHAAATYPILTLPVEITAEIFLWLRDLQPLCVPRCQMSGTIAVAGVCRAWRAIALATPRLWSNLRINFDGIEHEAVLKPLWVECFIDKWISRSRNCPLSLDFQSRSVLHFTESRLRHILRRYSTRIQTLSLDLGSRDLRPLRFDSAAFPLLEKVYLQYHSNPDEDVDFPRPMTIFANAPRFRELNMQWSQLDTTLLALPWSQLTKFQGRIKNLDLFALASNLVEVKCALFPNEGVSSTTLITHHNMKILILDNDCNLIQHLALPSLQHLDIAKMDNHELLEPFLKRSSPPLASLSMQALKGPTGNCFNRLCECMALVASTLEDVKLCNVPEDLKGISTISGIFPNLRSLQISLRNTDHESGLAKLLDFLYSPRCTLRACKFLWARSPFLDRRAFAGTLRGTHTHKVDTISGHLARLVQGGMSVYIGTEDKNYLVG